MIVEARGSVEFDARRTLNLRAIPVMEIVRVEPDSILYLDGEGNARTAWLFYDSASSGAVKVACEPGFPAVRGVPFRV